MAKTPYTAPTLTKVPLNQEQAVLSACSTSATSVKQQSTFSCIPVANANCRRSNSTTGQSDFGPSS